MNKDFDAWNQCKKNIDKRFQKKMFQSRDIWWCSIGLNIGDEENGKNTAFNRPVLIVKKLSANTFIGLPLTSTQRKGSWFIEITLNTKTSTVLLNQVRMFDIKRCSVKLGQLDHRDFKKVVQQLVKLIKEDI